VTVAGDPSFLGLTVQLCAAILIAILFLLLERGEAPTFHRWWSAAWCALSAALLALWAGFPSASPASLWAYQAFALFFVFALWRGVEALRGSETGRRAALMAGAAIAAWAAAVTTVVSFLPGRAAAEPASWSFAAHAALMFAGYALSAGSTIRLLHAGAGLGPRLLLAALAALAVVSLFYAALAYGILPRGSVLRELMRYGTFAETLLLFSASFAMLVTRTEHDQQRLSAFNLGLASAHRELVNTYALLRDEAERDHLTDAYNRMAFRHFWNDGVLRFPRGCVAIIDMDGLKAINDRNGHDMGDRAIRLLADAIRGLFRSEDPLFRWGGDEFLLLLPNAELADAQARLGRLNALLASAWDGPPPAPGAAWGLEPFQSSAEFAEALKRADSGMYASKRSALRERA
jgi:diguanylate cyclase (GGDEF)-like protein